MYTLEAASPVRLSRTTCASRAFAAVTLSTRPTYSARLASLMQHAWGAILHWWTLGTGEAPLQALRYSNVLQRIHVSAALIPSVLSDTLEGCATFARKKPSMGSSTLAPVPTDVLNAVLFLYKFSC